MPELSEETLNQIMTLVTTYGLNVVGGILMLIFGFMIAGWLKSGVRRALKGRRGVDRTLQGFFASLVYYIAIAFVIIAVLGQFGVQTASLVALLGAVGLAIGFALQGTLSNIAAGVMLLFFRPFRVGDYVEVGGQAGTIQELTLFTTELATPDNVQIILPNGAIWGQAIKNYSFHPRRRVDFVLGIAYGDRIETAMQIIEDVIGGDKRILQDPAYQVVVGELADSSVNIIVRVWVEAGDYWPVKFDLTRSFKEAFDAGGITIPFPQSELHLSPESAQQLKSIA